MQPLNSITCVDALEGRTLFAVDLACTAVRVDSFDPNALSLSVEADISNFGSSDDPPSGVGGIVLSTDQIINNSDDIRIGIVPPSESGRLTQETYKTTISLPGNIPAGDYFVGVALDIDSHVPELSESNNFSFSTNTIHIPKTYALSIQGTPGNDMIDVGLSDPQTLAIVMNKVTTKYPLSRVGSLAIDGGAGNDIIFEGPTMTLPVYFYGGDGNDALGGGAGNDTLSGGTGKDTLRGAGGHDRLNGNGGNDQLFGEDGPDNLQGGAGNDMLDGGASGDHIDGGDGNDTCYGQGGDDTMTSNDGSVDQLFGGGGKDIDTGDAGDIRQSVLLEPST